MSLECFPRISASGSFSHSIGLLNVTDSDSLYPVFEYKLGKMEICFICKQDLPTQLTFSEHYYGSNFFIEIHINSFVNYWQIRFWIFNNISKYLIGGSRA